jgi:hypothetical protein
MKHKIGVMARAGLVLLISAGVSCAQQKTISPADQAKVAASSTPARAQPSKVSWSSTRRVEVTDPVYQMTAYTLEVPTGWKYANTIARDPSCHGNGAALKYTVESPDGLTAILLLPGTAWSWSSSSQMQQVMASSHCPAVDIDSAASFLLSIAVPNLRPKAKVVAVLPLLPEGQASLADQLQKERQQNAATTRQYGLPPQKVTLDGARVRVQYERDGQPVEEMISAVIDCTESQLPALPRQPVATRRFCFSRSTVIMRAPLGHLDELIALPQVQGLSRSVQVNPEWQARLTRDQQAAFQRAQAAQNDAFQRASKDNDAANKQRLANGKAFQDNLKAGTDAAIASDRARQNAIDDAAHKTALFANDRQAFTNPTTGQTIEASSEYNHQWMSSDGSTLIQTNDHALDPNGVVYPVSQSWSELVPK